jgi:hypothetical protein
MTDYKELKLARDVALDSCGIGHDIETRLKEGNKAISEIAACFFQGATTQLNYNLLTNKPLGRTLKPDAVSHAIQTGLINTISTFIKWDISSARIMASQLLEDVNDHELAAKLFNIAGEL